MVAEKEPPTSTISTMSWTSGIGILMLVALLLFSSRVSYLGQEQINTLLKRRARIVEHLAGLIQEKGASRVLYSIWPNQNGPTSVTMVGRPD